jgi:hypothetical protein
MSMPVLKLRQVVGFPGNIVGGTGIEATKAHGTVTIDMAWNEFGRQTAIPTSPTNNILTFDTVTGQYVMIPSSLLGGATAGIADAPTDGLLYGRRSANWEAVPSGATIHGYNINVFDYMTAAEISAVLSFSPSLNHTAAVGAAINAANALYAATVIMPAGVYSIDPGGLPEVICNIDGPGAFLVARTNATAAVLTLSVSPSFSYNANQRIVLNGILGYNFSDTRGTPRYGIGLQISAGDAQYTYGGGMEISIASILGFLTGFYSTSQFLNYHVSGCVFNIHSIGYCDVGISITVGTGDAATFEDNLFNIEYMTFCQTAIFCQSLGTHSLNLFDQGFLVQNIFNIQCMEVGRIHSGGEILLDLAGSRTLQNEFNFPNLSWEPSTTQWLVITDALPVSNIYRLSAYDSAKISMGADILEIKGNGETTKGNAPYRTVIYGDGSSAPTYPGLRIGDRYIINNPAPFGAASLVYTSGGWGEETFASNLAPSAWTPTATADTPGAFAATCTGWYSINGGVLSYQVTVHITNNGSGTGAVRLNAFPVSPTSEHVTCGRANGVSGLMLQAFAPAGGSLIILRYDGAYPGATGEQLMISGQFKIS